jgi:hypothetical protein
MKRKVVLLIGVLFLFNCIIVNAKSNDDIINTFTFDGLVNINLPYDGSKELIDTNNASFNI